MARDTISKLLWLMDTIKRHKHITLKEINVLWAKSKFSDGGPLSRRTFYNYRDSICDIFNVNIECNPRTFEYYIEENEHQQTMIDWVLNSTATNNLITSARDIHDRVFLENVPSAREYLAVIIEALRANAAVSFDYHSYSRSRPTKDIRLEPYFTKVFKQRWYVVGRNVKENKIKTYALDRMANVAQSSDTFSMPPGFSPDAYFKDAFGIVVDASEPRNIKIKADSTQAKYLRALPLHSSQSEMVNDAFSIFTYRMRITGDLVNELLSYGSRITVLEPPELRVKIIEELSSSLKKYQ